MDRAIPTAEFRRPLDEGQPGADLEGDDLRMTPGLARSVVGDQSRGAGDAVCGEEQPFLVEEPDRGEAVLSSQTSV